MKTQLTALLVTLSFSGLAIAANLDDQTIQMIHQQVKSTFTEKCKQDMKGGALPTTCECLGDKAQSLLSDSDLKTCTNDESGKQCVAKVVSDAATQAMSPAVISACSSPAAQPATTN